MNKAILTGGFLLLSIVATAQEIIKDSIYSNILKEQRKIEVVLPDDYKPGSPERFEVTYVTDGEWNTKIVANLQRFAGYDFMPKNIIVSLPNTYVKGANMRLRDLTPSHTEGNDVSGGADNYIAFLKNELIPYIEKKYPTKGARTYHGGSLGGLFGMYTFLQEPELFQSYTLSDPAFWWDDGLVMKMAAAKLPNLPNPDRTVYFTGREGRALSEMGVKEMDSIFRAKAPKALHWKMQPYAGETHNSMIFKTVYDGFKFTYEGYAKEDIEFHPMGGIFIKDKPFNLYANLNEFQRVKYSIDGSEPTISSPEVKAGWNSVALSDQLILTAFDARKDFNRTMKGNFKVGTVIKPTLKLPKIKPGGLDTLAGNINGFVEVKEEGYYILALMDPTSNVNISFAGQPVIRYDSATDKGHDQTYLLPLAKGFYPLQLKYTGIKAPALMYVTPGKDHPVLIPNELLYHR